MSFRFEIDELKALKEDVLRALIREAAHHGVETRLYPSLQGKKDPFATPPKIKKLLDVYEAQGFDMDKPDVRWAKEIIALAETWHGGTEPQFEGHAPEFNAQVLEMGSKLIYGRRSIRQWTDQKVDRELLLEIVKAGTYAPCACLVQGVRYLVLDDPADLAAIKSREFAGEAAKIITVVDKRAFDILSHIPRKNLLLDVGAAMQNMLLMAEALGLGAVWGTLNEREVAEIVDYFSLPGYYDVVAYISIGYAAERVLTPGRITVEEAILNK